MYSLRLLTEDDYPTLVRWWKQNRFPVPDQSMLPNNGSGGIMLYKEKTEICAGFLYMTNSSICWIEFIVANFYYRESDRDDMIQAAIRELSLLAQRKGYKAAFSSIKHEGLIKHYEAVGYKKGSTGAVEMIIGL